MTARPTRGRLPSLRTICAALALGLAVLSSPLPGLAQDLPRGFFDEVPVGKEARVEADLLSYDSAADTVTALGAAIMRYDGYVVTAERIIYNRKTSEVTAEGNVGMLDPRKNLYRMDRIELTGQMKDAFIQSMTLTTPSGELITAISVTSPLLGGLIRAVASEREGAVIDKVVKRMV